MKFSSVIVFLLIHLICLHLALAADRSFLSPWARSNIETDRALELLPKAGSAPTSSIVVAIVDTGADQDHPGLQGRLWTNPREIPNNGIDDDGNGFIDDVHGWNFVDNNNNLTDQHDHGTHVAGIIANQSAAESELMILKYFDPKASAQTNIDNTIRAFRYAVQMNAQIINFSGGGPGFNAAEALTLQEAEKKNILVVAAAGNDGANSDQLKYYPADYGFSNIISVTAINRMNQSPSYANYGTHTVDIAAPGDQILSILPQGRTGEMSGTSQATAFVTAVATLLLAQNPWHPTPQELIQRLRSTGQLTENLVGRIKSGARVNAFRALAMRDSNFSADGHQIGNLEKMDQGFFTIRPSR